MSTEEPNGPYVYQSYGAITHPERAAVGRLFAVSGIEPLGMATVEGLTRMEAEAVKAALASEPNKAVMLLYKCYQCGHRHGWEDGSTTNEVMAEVNDFMCNHFGSNWQMSFASTRCRMASEDER